MKRVQCRRCKRDLPDEETPCCIRHLFLGGEYELLTWDEPEPKEGQ
jgi:hypothetical protein